MCGRTACTLAPDELCQACSSGGLNIGWRDSPGGQQSYTPSYNLPPTMHTPVIYSGKHLKALTSEEPETEYIMQPMMWSLVPHFYKGDTPHKHGYKTSNCRVETVHDKQMFSHLVNKGQRCVVVCDGFYEWQSIGTQKTKTPYFIYAQQPDHVRLWDAPDWENKVKTKASTQGDDGENLQRPTLLKMAGLFSRWRSREGELWSYTVLTMAAGKSFSWLHHRVPVVLSTHQDVKAWLDYEESSAEAVLRRISGDPSLKWHAVATTVNNTRNNTPACMAPLDPVRKKKAETSSSKFMSAWLKKAELPKPQTDDVKDERCDEQLERVDENLGDKPPKIEEEEQLKEHSKRKASTEVGSVDINNKKCKK